MTGNQARIGAFTSSEIYKLLKKNRKGDDFGDLALTYIAETNYERLLGCSIDKEVNARELGWGKLLEGIVFNDERIGIDYTLTSTETDTHPQFAYWAGSKDGTREIVERTVFDFKCPFTRKSLVQLTMPVIFGFDGLQAMNMIRNGFTHQGFDYPAHKDGEKYYWQLVSNCIINKCDYAELIIYMPYQKDLLKIKQAADGNPAMYWMNFAEDNQIPFLPDDCKFPDLSIIRFEVPKEDKELLTATVVRAGNKLIPLANAA